MDVVPGSTRHYASRGSGYAGQVKMGVTIVPHHAVQPGRRVAGCRTMRAATKRSIMYLRLCALSVSCLILPAVVQTRAAEPNYSLEDVRSCSSDAMRLCKDKIPDLDAIRQCMKANYSRLHPACKARFKH